VLSIHEAFTYLRVKDAPRAIEFYRAAFEAREKFRLVEPSGRVGHAELELGPVTLMLSEEFAELEIYAPRAGAPTASAIHLHVDDADALIARCVEFGATVVRPAADHFYGERSGTVRDPFGHDWHIGHSIESVTPDEMQRRYTALFNP
jgi:uncharacterized glyoxalase superfamily protein PhnB